MLMGSDGTSWWAKGTIFFDASSMSYDNYDTVHVGEISVDLTDIICCIIFYLI